jgi:hypothetical protein
MPEETRQGVENIKKGEIDKRKKAWEEKEGPPTKKFKVTNTKSWCLFDDWIILPISDLLQYSESSEERSVAAKIERGGGIGGGAGCC